MSYKEKYVKYKNKCIELKNRLNTKIQSLLSKDEYGINTEFVDKDYTIDDVFDQIEEESTIENNQQK